MTQEEKELINEKIGGIEKIINAKFDTLHETLKSIDTQAKLTNSRVTHAESDIDALEKKVNDAIVERNAMIYNHSYNCPNLDEIRGCRIKIEKIEKEMEDMMFFIRHPKLFLGGIVVLVILSLLTFIENNDWIKNLFN